MVLFKDGLIECVFGRIQVFGGLMIADYRGDGLVLVQPPSWLEGRFGCSCPQNVGTSVFSTKTAFTFARYETIVSQAIAEPSPFFLCSRLLQESASSATVAHTSAGL